MKKTLLMCLVVLFLCGCNSKNSTKNHNIDCNKKNELLSKGAILIDVRTEEEYKTSHLDNSINIPVDEILDGLIALDLKKDDVIIVYCNSGNRSIVAYRELTNNGYENVYDFGAMSKCSK